MKFFYLYILFRTIESLNINKPCINCKYYIKSNNNDINLGRCKLFLNIDDVTGYEYYTHTYIIRNNEKLCGKKGNFFLKK